MISDIADVDNLFVFAFLPGNPVPVPAGRLLWSANRSPDGNDPVFFTYGQRYAARPEAWAFDPLPERLPLDPDLEFMQNGLTRSFGVFADALPDSWGQLVLKHINQGRPLTVPEMLLNSSGGQRIGALEFGLENDITPFMEPEPVITADQLYEGVLKVEKGLPLDEKLARLLRPGTSLGGARPKSSLSFNDQLWIVKFPDINDYGNIARIEHATMTLAASCGIPIPETQILPLSDNKEALLVKRFDRDKLPEGLYARIPYLSAATICAVPAAESSYLRFADELRRCAAEPAQELSQLFRRMVFNIAVNNCDDHYKNHGALLNPDGKATLSPAFDVVAAQGEARGQAMEVGLQGRSGNRANVLSGAARFLLSKDEAEGIIDEVVTGVSSWREVFSDCGVSDTDCDNYQWAFSSDLNA